MDLPCETITKPTFRHEMQSSRNTEAALVDNLPIPVENRKRGRPLGSKNVQFKTEKAKKAFARAEEELQKFRDDNHVPGPQDESPDKA